MIVGLDVEWMLVRREVWSASDQGIVSFRFSTLRHGGTKDTT